jgi:hypothetical protein
MQCPLTLDPLDPIQTSINLPGFSLTLLLLPREDDNRASASDIVSLLDAPTDAPGWIPIFEPRSVDALTIQDEHEGETLVKNSGSPVSCTCAVIGLVPDISQAIFGRLKN